MSLVSFTDVSAIIVNLFQDGGDQLFLVVRSVSVIFISLEKSVHLFRYKFDEMTKKEIKICVEEFNSSVELKDDDAFLLKAAREETKNAYAPYSNFHVGAVARLVNGELIKGTNQENAAYPAGICAERVLMSTAASLFPGTGIDTIAISYNNTHGKSDKPISPCGICRQSLLEFQSRTNKTIRVILSGLQGQVYILENATDLLPLVFSADDMK